jgi:DNA invertase Pin-like site-specific DNA recombinase
MKEEPTMKPFAGYVRVSRRGERDEERLRSPEFQEKAIKRYAKDEGLTVRMFAPEIDVSGSKPQRERLDEIIRQIRSGELGGVIVAKLDRLSRLKPKDRVLLFESIEESGGVVLSASEQLDPSTPEGRFARDVFLGVARLQWEKFRDQFEVAKANAVEKGIAINSRAAVGYRWTADRRLELDPRTAPIVREVFERRVRGEGPSSLARFLESKHVKTSQGSRTWSKQAVYGLLRNPVYAGVLRYGSDDRFVNAASHEAIVDLALFKAAQKTNGTRPAPLRSERSPWLLAGLLRCSGCRYSMQGTTTSRGRRIYRCTRVHSGGVCPAPAHISADLIEAEVVAEFWRQREAVKATARKDGGKERNLERALERAETVLARLIDPTILAVAGDLPAHAESIRKAREARDEAAEALGRERARDGGEKLLPVETLRAAWDDGMPTADRRDLLGQHFDCLALGRDRRLVAFPRGTGPTDLPRRGFTQAPVLVGFDADVPAGAGILALQVALEPGRDGGVGFGRRFGHANDGKRPLVHV